jgi:hypothetical protein
MNNWLLYWPHSRSSTWLFELMSTTSRLGGTAHSAEFAPTAVVFAVSAGALRDTIKLGAFRGDGCW